MFLQLWYYTPPALRGRLWYLADPDAAIRHTGSDTIDRGLLALARWTPVNVADYASFVGKHPKFRVYAAGSGWLLDQWRIDGGVAVEVGAEPGARLLDVQRSSCERGVRAGPEVGVDLLVTVSALVQQYAAEGEIVIGASDEGDESRHELAFDMS